MKLRFTPDAAEQAEDSDRWWRRHRRDARDLFARELADVTSRIAAAPGLGIGGAPREHLPNL
jgi:hypothetical protein